MKLRYTKLTVMFLFVALSIKAQLNIIAVWDSIDCHGGKTSIDIQISNGVAPFSYDWSNGSDLEDLSDISAGNYIVVVTDYNGKQGIKQINIPEPEILEVDLVKSKDAVCNNNPVNVFADVSGGTAPYSYKWNDNNLQTNDTAFNLIAGDYKVSVTDSKGCRKTESFDLQSYSPINIELQAKSNIKCKGGKGTIAISANGGAGSLKYLWSNGSESNILSNVYSGDYSVTISDIAGCTQSRVFTLEESEHELIVDKDFSVNTTNPSCVNDNNGSISISSSIASGLNAIYSSDNGLQGQMSINNPANLLFPGNYFIEVTDNKCVAYDTVKIEAIEPVTISTSINFENNCFSVNINAQGGNGGYLYSIDGGSSFSTKPEFLGLKEGTYEILVKDSLGCQKNIEDFKLASDTTAIKNYTSQEIGLELYPNPNNGVFTIHYENIAKENIKISVIDLIGNTIYSEEINSSVNHVWKEIILEDPKSGLYFIQIDGKNTKAGSRFLVK